MKSKLLAVLVMALAAFAFTGIAQAQTEMTNDVIFIKAGYVPISNTTFDKGATRDGVSQPTIAMGDLEGSGWALQGEYNLNFQSFWVGIGLEYQRIKVDDFEYTEGTTKAKLTSHTNQFIMPMVSGKFVAGGGLYLGAGLGVKYMTGTQAWGDTTSSNKYDKWEKKTDLWGHAIVGWFTPVAEGVYLDIEGRFGYNFTKNQYESFKDTDPADSHNWKLTPKSAYDMAIYVGVGFRASASGI